jgi:hypothetical protein
MFIMKSKYLLIFICCTILFILSGCNLPASETAQPEINVTQAYQTVEAQLTKAVGQTSEPTETPTPTVEQTPTPTTEITLTTPPEEPTNTPIPGKPCDLAAAAYPKIDITIEDDTEMAPGEAFTKVWRVVNAGGCTWTTSYTVVWFSGEQLSAPSSLPVNFSVAPNQTLDISVDMVAPEGAGTYQSNWKLRNANGDLFGIGPNGESPFWVRIKVVGSGTAAPTLPPESGTPTATPETHSSGSVTLGLDDVLDFDDLVVNAGGADALFQVIEDDSPQYQLATLSSASIAVFGGAQPSSGNCQAVGLSAAAITVNDLAVGTYLCYNTDQGRYGWARIDGFDPGAGTITLAILTWDLP